MAQAKVVHDVSACTVFIKSTATNQPPNGPFRQNLKSNKRINLLKVLWRPCGANEGARNSLFQNKTSVQAKCA